MNQREKLIEAAAKVFGGITSASWDDADEWEREKVLEGMARALAVFEGAYANDLARSSERVKNQVDSLHVETANVSEPRVADISSEQMSVSAYAVEIGDQLFTQAQWEAVQRYHHGSDLAVAVPGDSKDLRVSESPVQGEPTRDSEEHLRGRWSNGDPVHIITDGSNRHVAPNLNGATWIPGAVEPYDRYAEHDRAKREGGYCRGCDEKFPAPQGEPSDAQVDAAIRAFHEHTFGGPDDGFLTEERLATMREPWCAALRAAAAIEGGEHRGS